MTETNNGTYWSNLREAGLVREGVHFDTNVVAKTPDGTAIAIDVFPMQINDGQDTYFVPLPNEASKTNQILPKTPKGYL